MNLIERLFMQAAGELCEKIKRGSPEETVLANTEALDVLKKLDPTKLEGLVVMGIQSCEPDKAGNKGFELISSMIGSPELITHLASGARVFTQMYQVQEMQKKFGLPMDDESLAAQLLGGSAIQGGEVSGRYEVPEGATKQ